MSHTRRMRRRVAGAPPASIQLGSSRSPRFGIEEQRVHTTIDFVDPPETWSRLGHDYRVIVHVTVWEDENILTVPVGALFRQAEEWAVFAVKDGRARTTPVKVGHRNYRLAEILSGISEADRVALHPSDRVKDGVAVAERQTH